MHEYIWCLLLTATALVKSLFNGRAHIYVARLVSRLFIEKIKNDEINDCDHKDYPKLMYV